MNRDEAMSAIEDLYGTQEEIIDIYQDDCCCPYICSSCGYADEAEHDVADAKCPECGKKSCNSYFVLLGVI